MKKTIFAFVAGLILAALIFYQLGPRSDGRVEEEKSPIGAKTTTVAVGEVLDGIRGMNHLVVFRSYLTAITRSQESVIFGGLAAEQTVITPAFVNYYIDMADIKAGDIQIDGDTIRIKLPTLMIERPNIDVPRILVVDQGAWSSVSNVSKRLWAKNSRMTMKQLFQRANMKFLLKEARRQAVADVEHNVGLMFNRGEKRPYKVVASFGM